MKALIFDMDAVLLDSRQAVETCIALAVEHFLGQRVERSAVRSLLTRRPEAAPADVASELLRGMGVVVPGRRIAHRIRRTWAGDDFQGPIREQLWLLRPDVARALSEKVDEEGRTLYRLSAVTSRPEEQAAWLLDRHEVRSLFEVVLCEQEGGGKLEPAGLRLAMRQAGCRRGVLIGEDASALDAAEAAGFEFVAVLPPFHERGAQIQGVLQRRGVTTVVHDVNEIEQVLS